MPAFEYQALNTQGKIVKGVLQAEGASDARRLIRDMALEPVQVDSTRARKSSSIFAFSSHIKLSTTELSLVTRKLATLINSGLPVEESLQLTQEQSTNRTVQRVLSSVRSDISEGESLEQGLSHFPNAFDQLYRASIAAGERSGHLGAVLEELAEHLERQNEQNKTVATALIYPSILVAMSLMVVFGLMTWVVPSILDTILQAGQEIPRVTQGLINVSDFLSNWGLIIFAVIASIAIGFKGIVRWFGLNEGIDRAMLKIPGFGDHLKASISARYASTLSLLTASGISLDEAMEIGSKVTTNRAAYKGFEKAKNLVIEGKPLHKALSEIDLLPAFLVQLASIGEQSGSLADMLKRGAAIIQNEHHQKAQTIARLLEPLTLVIMGVVVLIIMIAIMLPIMNISASI